MPRRLSDVAAFAGVSVATVSRVLHDKPGIAQATRDSVLTALDVFGYERPQKLRNQRAPLIGLVLPELQNPIFPAMAELVVTELIRRNLLPVLCTRTADGLPEAHYVQMLLAQDVGGIVFIGSSYADAGAAQVKELRARKLPIVLINAADENLDVPRVCVDDGVAVRQALGHLRALGHERIGLILGPVGHVPSARKLAAFGREAAERGEPGWRALVAHTIFTMEGGATAAARLVGEGATALVCASDALALGAVKAVRKQGLRVPADVSVVGFDDSSLMSVTDPPLTTVRQPVAAMGGAAVAALMSQINGHVVPVDEVLFDPELIVRGSTGMCPAR
ncbi:LacI family DNA-binding transcriptional regulator [Nonomuraea fuscirosea]|jgi:DNA-binding LacI/PurR family transcriptional regulator|uniref:LacI family DNA-binding transcriptional regulator n=1 Tax=Nonomuraea fuscirosea TaxID=1291556 RepID=UPI002DD85D71|nr:LacI family DNA-binding transcriptional regulator [Nonomuraea fuscirosea]WSA58026.1 LacI family transcriptional regulator [Nonomuraea fuscirosea]